MDDPRFDALTRRLGGASTRRAGLKAALGGLLGAGLGTLAPAAGDAKKKHKRSARCGPDKPCPDGQVCDGEGTPGARCLCAGGQRPCNGVCCPDGQSCNDDARNPVCRCDADGRTACGGACCARGQECFAGFCTAGPLVCPSGQELRDVACSCTRELCGGACCAGNESCQDGRCVVTGMRECVNPLIADGVDLSYCNLGGKAIRARTLRHVNFEGADLTQATFPNYFQPWDCSFRGATLVRANFYEADIKPGTSFVGADLTGAKLADCHIAGADFRDATLAGANLSNTTRTNGYTQMADTSFVGADLSGALLDGDEIRRCDFTRARLTGADVRAWFYTSKFDDADLANAAVGWTDHSTNTMFRGCSMRRAVMTGQRYTKKGWPDGSWPGIDFMDVDLEGAVFGDPYGVDEASWLRTTVEGASGWRQPTGNYTYRCSLTLPDGRLDPDSNYYDISDGKGFSYLEGIPCDEAPDPLPIPRRSPAAARNAGR